MPKIATVLIGAFLEFRIGSNQDQGLLTASQKCENLKHRLRSPFFCCFRILGNAFKNGKKDSV